jgi:transcriptional regulator with XRE-family HTH domain
MLQPEEIREFRDQLGLTQRELSDLLGWGGATLSRYENGALQDQGHDRLLRLAMEPSNFLSLINNRPHTLTPKKAERLASLLSTQISHRRSLSSMLLGALTNYPPTELSGYRRFDIDRFTNAVLFFCADLEVFKTKLNKLLFYADFKHYKEYAVSITGARYAHLTYGPGPDKYDLILSTLVEDEGSIVLEERPFPEYVGEVVKPLRSPDISPFSSSEVKVLASVREQFESLTAKQISELSHKEAAYLQTAEGDMISYKLADSLSI